MLASEIPVTARSRTRSTRPRLVIVLGYKGALTLPEYVRTVRNALAFPDGYFGRSFTGLDPVDGREILRQFRYGVNDRINRRGGLTIREASPSRIDRTCRARLKTQCRWCGSEMPWKPHGTRFCDPGCARAYSGF